MKPILNCYNDAFTAFEQWNLTDFVDRKSALSSLVKKLPEELAKVFNYQLEQTEPVVSTTLSLVSPTGETNELYTQGRGVSVVLVDSNQDKCGQAVVAMVTALLASGNSVIVCSDNNSVNQIVAPFTQEQALANNVLQLTGAEEYHQLIKLDIRNLVFIGSTTKAIELNKELAMRPSAITAMVAETDLDTLPNCKDPKLALRFVTEKVRSINITAIGGNAMLLELGNSAH